MKDLSSYLQTIETAIKAALADIKPNTEALLYDALEYALCGGGKRVRPLLMLLSAETIKMPIDKVVSLAVALECIHTYSLVHDDLPCMDNDDYRRGRLTVHKVYGEGIAVLVGDALLNLAYELLLDACTKDSTLTKASLAIAKAAGCVGMVGGQAIDISRVDYNKGDIVQMYAQKTGALIKAAIVVPYIVSQADSLHLVAELGDNIGLIFQLVDDIIDYRAGEDEDKKTYIKLAGEKKTLDKVQRLNDKCIDIYNRLGLEESLLCEYTSALCHRLK